MALTHVATVQLGSYKWENGQKCAKMRSKWHNDTVWAPLLVEHHFWKTAFLTAFDQFWCTKWPSSKAVEHLAGAKKAQNGLKMGSFHVFVHFKWSTTTPGKTSCSPSVAPKTAHFQGISGLSTGEPCHSGLERGYKHLFEHPKRSRNMFFKNETMMFSPEEP